MQQAVLDDLELQLADCSNDLAVVELIDKQLCNALIHQLLDTLVELLGLHWIAVLDILKHFGREAGQALEVKFFTLGERITNLKDAVVGQAHNVTWIDFVDDLFFLSHKSSGCRKTVALTTSHVLVIFIAMEHSRANLDKCDATAVVGIHVGMYLEDEASELLLLWTHLTLLSHDRAGRRSYAHKTIQQFLDAKGVQRRAEKHGSHHRVKIVLFVKLRINTIDQFNVGTQLFGIVLADSCINGRVIDITDFNTIGNMLLVGLEQIESVLIDIVYALEFGTDVNGPTQRTYANLQFLLELIKDVKRISALTIQLVDKNDNRGVAHATHLHQFACLRLDALCHIHHDDNTVNGCKCAVSVLCKVLVAWCVQDVDLVITIVKAHD